MVDSLTSVTVKIQLTDPEASIPSRSTSGSAGYDVCIIEDVIMEPFTIYKIRTGLKMEIPEGYFLDIRPRSGLSMKGFCLVNSPGTIDSDYRGEIHILARFIPIGIDDTCLELKKGSRVAQAILFPAVTINFTVSDSLSNSDRGENGFGHTGI